MEAELAPQVTFDSQVFTYLVEANSGAYNPATDTDQAVAQERIAALRIFLYHDVIVIPPTVAREFRSISDPERRQEHELFARVHLIEPDHLDPAKVDALATYYHGLHPSMNDCRIVAEAELLRIDFLLTHDADLFKHLGRRPGYPVLALPSWFWQFMKIPRGKPPKWAPHPTHPLSQADWWRWTVAPENQEG